MKNQSKLGPAFTGVVAARADGNDPVKLIEQISQTFEAFKASNDERIKGIKAGFDDVVKNDEVDRINATISDLTASLNALTERNANANLGAGDADAKAILVAEASAAFSAANGSPVELSVEQYDDYVAGMNNYMRKSKKNAALEVGSDPAGGYTVTPDTTGRIVTKVFETSDMRNYASVETIGTDSYEGFNDREEGSSGWVGEKQARTETGTPNLGKWEIPVHEQYAEPKATQKLLDDSSWDIEEWLARKTSTKFAREENTAFVTGNGILKPKGFLAYDTAATADDARAWEVFQYVASGSTSGFSSTDKLVDFVFSLKAAYRDNANWFMNRKTVSEIRKLKDGDGNYLWTPNFEKRQGGDVLGYGVAEFEDMPDIAANALSIAFGDMKETYTIVDRKGISVLRDPLTQKGFVKFYTTKRVGGGALNFDSMKLMKFAAS